MAVHMGAHVYLCRRQIHALLNLCSSSGDDDGCARRAICRAKAGKSWRPPLRPSFLESLRPCCVGFVGNHFNLLVSCARGSALSTLYEPAWGWGGARRPVFSSRRVLRCLGPRCDDRDRETCSARRACRQRVADCSRVLCSATKSFGSFMPGAV